VVEEREETDDGLEDAVEEGHSVDWDALTQSAIELWIEGHVNTTYRIPKREGRRRQALSS
jgi:hypothetical protein